MIDSIDYMALEYVESEFLVNFGARSASEWRFTQIPAITKLVCQKDSAKDLFKQFNSEKKSVVHMGPILSDY